MTLSISSAFDAGNIRVLSTDCSGPVWRAELDIVPDHQSDHRQLRGFGISRWLAEL
jgi:hypothetical protein